ncbi:acyl-CoA thioesterase [Ammoniphilus resinae]|uniref:Acyl-CoA thioester hydrolase n=1 Tax=Ammoniphilus resinae TaxID=861532 RepID=A0ABS4GP30_9BACL|nr:thioesterase family protein [Ammoniphilus resinae]MBP1931615.1 acyl-CoA thioester hydrolase [Ammoniphilus resinae]
MFTQHLIPRFAETDALGHINNNVIPNWFESARIDVFRLFNEDLDLKNWNLIIASLSVDFIKQIYYGLDVTIRTSIERIGNSSFVIFQEVVQQNEVCASGRITMVYFNFKTQRAESIPSAIREQLEKHLKA